MASVNLADVMNQIGEFQKTMQADRTTAANSLEENRRLGEERVAAAQTLVDLSTKQTQIENDQKLQMEERKKATADAFGVDILDPNNRLVMLASEQAAQIDNYIQRSKRAQNLIDMNMFDSPLDYFLVRPFAHRDINAANASKETATVIGQAITNLNSQAQSSVKTQDAINETFTKEQAAINLEKVAIEAQDKVRSLRMGLNTQTVNDLTALRGMDEKAINMNVTGYKLANEAAEFAARMALHRDQLAERAKAKKEEKLGLDAMLAYYNKAAENLGKPQIADVQQFSAMLKTPIKDTIAQQVNYGMSLGVDANTPADFIGRTPGEAIVTISGLRGNLPQTATKTGELLRGILPRIDEETAKMMSGKGRVTPEIRANAINANLMGQVVSKQTKEGTKSVAVPGVVDQMKTNAEDSVKGFNNIYRAPDPATLATTYPKLTGSNWWKEIIAPVSLAAPNPTADQVIKRAQLAVAENKVTPEEAATGITTYYKAAVELNKRTEQYQRFGLPLQVDYVARVAKGKTAFGSDRVTPINLIDEKQVLHTLIVNRFASTMPAMFATEQAALAGYQEEKSRAAKLAAMTPAQRAEADRRMQIGENPFSIFTK